MFFNIHPNRLLYKNTPNKYWFRMRREQVCYLKNIFQEVKHRLQITSLFSVLSSAAVFRKTLVLIDLNKTGVLVLRLIAVLVLTALFFQIYILLFRKENYQFDEIAAVFFFPTVCNSFLQLCVSCLGNLGGGTFDWLSSWTYHESVEHRVRVVQPR